MADPSHRVTITVAIIGLVGTLGAALLSNWDKIFTRAPQPPVEDHQLPKPPKDPIETPSANPTPNISGNWRDSDNPDNGTKVSQVDSRFAFTRWGTLPSGVRFESSGTGSLVGSRLMSRYTAKYQSGDVSSGGCNGSVSADATRIEQSCSDSLLGAFTNIAERQ
ncbi:hypothetical protein KBY84_01325 [Cyanobium sp. N.Huapi 1H5]|uniref:hypothetical protein n=1 Tax=Cyanobium sp. N.Huapi 1H5 TaxID=2823719 RepID=UPI0020CF23A7|nr:hypothetical protein [Cyanobium sp. N.Huapi 1H5]MCP9836131.1 hypothetical protein [Cyanobium sp. N.Huapi 1H5]